MLPAYSVFAGAINKAVKGILHFSHIYPDREFKALEEHLLIKCYNRFVRDPDCYYMCFSKRDREVKEFRVLWMLLRTPRVLRMCFLASSGTFSA